MKHDEAHAASRPGAGRTMTALMIVAAFGAGLLGGLAAHWLDGEPTAGSDMHPSSADAQAATQAASELRALTEAVTALAQRSAREPAPGASDGAPELLRVDATDALNSAVASLAESVTRLSAQHPSSIERSNFTLPVDTQAARARVDALYGRDKDVVKREHFFLSVRDIVERYGMPDELSDNDAGLILTYNGADGRTHQSFWTHQGIVTSYQRQ